MTDKEKEEIKETLSKVSESLSVIIKRLEEASD